MKPGIYTVRCNALYRVGDNDGGAAYQAGTEDIQAYFYVNDKMEKVKSLYSETWPEASRYGSVDNLNGYPHSMRAAEIRFSEGCYQNEIAYTQEEKGSLRIGLKGSNHINDSWCCFDNFSITYKPIPHETGIRNINHYSLAKHDIYSIQGYKTNASHRGIIVKDGVKVVKR